MTEPRIEALSSVGAIEAAAWDRLVGSDGSPFLEHAWLAALEQTGCVGGSSGWRPRPIVAHDGDRIVGALPLYEKAHSFGEYVYDFGWAQLALRLGQPYYPKLVVTTPLSPVSGTRILVDPAFDPDVAETVRTRLVDAALALAHAMGAGGIGFLFTDEAETARLVERHGMFARVSYQYHWHNDGYATFDQFLDRFESKRRREIRRERRRLAEAGYRVTPVAGKDLTAEQRDALFEFYATTCARYTYGGRYLNRAFFETVFDELPDRVLAMLAHDSAGDLVGGTFNIVKGDRLYGRYWGARRDVPGLHFETCYYATLEHAIERGVQVMEPGAGGEHKYARGFDPTETYSAHWIPSPRMDLALRYSAELERDHVTAEIAALRAQSPLRRPVAGGETDGESR
ncbi:MAG: GNAT family N-acetyltransferase [Myxococcales bacterium]|nr:GNAT family N-acetyltransferase [Myxococcales bacterium]MCB9519740.1 GNAT family N-acetyltransferase [Myxococcales bacterium]MCB9530431.1 GNAT family N-acetyltransferase [Myxococcales bacterium]MCB9533678.1 GNAT family N-acetyltransferase [Myxococcales bacterium]